MAKRAERPYDRTLFVVIMTMLVLGMAVLYSASQVLSLSKTGSSTYYFFHQFLYGVVPGLVLLYFLSRVDYHVWRKYSPIIILVCIVGLFAVLLPHVGYRVGNSKRWIAIGSVSLQVSEFAKLALIAYIATWIDKRGRAIETFSSGLLPLLAVIGIVAGLIFLEPDIGTMLIVMLISFSMLYVGGASTKHLGALLLAGIIFLAIIVKLEPYRVARFVTFLNPDQDKTGISYQIRQALLAVGSGGYFGAGYGQSLQKRNYLPEVMGDSVFAVTAEELGFVRSSLIIILYLLFAFRGLKIAKHAPDDFGRLLATGIVAWVMLEALVNIGAIIGVLPLTGVPLPLISYGSSSIIAILAALGILLNISKHSAV